MTYSYGKQLLAPGMRIGYLTVPPTMPDRVALRDRVLLAQVAGGYLFPNALLQHAIEDLEGISIDIGALQRRRDRMVAILAELGFEHTVPEGTFYVMARSPIPEDMRFAEILAEEGAVVLPGAVVEVPGLVPDLADGERRDGRVERRPRCAAPVIARSRSRPSRPDAGRVSSSGRCPCRGGASSSRRRTSRIAAPDRATPPEPRWPLARARLGRRLHHAGGYGDGLGIGPRIDRVDVRLGRGASGGCGGVYGGGLRSAASARSRQFRPTRSTRPRPARASSSGATSAITPIIRVPWSAS